MTTPTRDVDEQAPRISGKAELVERLSRGAKPAAQWRIGTEHEKIGFATKDLTPLAYEGRPGIKLLLEEMQRATGWSAILEGENIIGLKNGLASVSLEPGGQFELSGAPLETIHQTSTEIFEHLDAANEAASGMGAAFLSLGFSPKWSLAETPLMPKGRYGIMRAYMEKVGRLGREMMFRSCTVQTNLDFASEADMVQKMRVSLALQPLANALFGNSPFAEGRTNGFLSYRGHVWTDTDPDRTGMLPFMFEQGASFESYVDYALDVPMYFVRRGGKYINCSGQPFRKFMEGELPCLPGEKPAIDDWDDHISTIFPEVRLKSFLEMRGADAGPHDQLCAVSAFWTGLLYDAVALDGAWQIVKDWTAAERESLRMASPVLGLKAPIRNTDLQAIGLQVLELAREGLHRRGRLDAEGWDESRFLVPIEETLAKRQNPAERLLARYRGEWKGDIAKVFEACRY